MVTKQTYKNRIYKLSKDLLSGIHTDDAWQDLHAVFNNMRNNNYDVIVTSTEYDNMNSKTYYFEIDNIEHKIRGHITCAFCGTCNNPMDRYDMSMILY